MIVHEFQKINGKVAEKAKKDGSKIRVLHVVEYFCPLGLADFDCNNIRELLFKEGKSLIDFAVNGLKTQVIDVKI